MKKVTVIFAVLVLATTIKVNAQGAGKVSTHDVSMAPTAPASKIGAGHLILPVANLKEGQNTLLTKEGKGTLTFVKRGDSFSDVIYKDSTGSSTRLLPTQGGANGAPKPECKTELPDACFGTADKTIGMCICKPGDISNGRPGTYYIKLQVRGHRIPLTAQ